MKFWYMDATKRTHVAVYKNYKLMQRDVERASRYQWVPQTSAAQGGRGSALAVLGGAAVLGPVGMVMGAVHRGKGSITMTFVRAQGWYPPTAQELQVLRNQQLALRAQQSEQAIRALKVIGLVLYVLYVGWWLAIVWLVIGGVLAVFKVPTGHTMLAQVPAVLYLRKQDPRYKS